MKQTTLFLCLTFSIMQALCGYGYPSLPDSRQRSAEQLIYKLDFDDLVKIYLDDDVKIDESMLHTFVKSVSIDNIHPEEGLEHGNYIAIKVINDYLHHYLITVDDFNYELLPTEDVSVYLFDSNFKPITDSVTCNYKMRFDKKTLTYTVKGLKPDDMLIITHKGVYHFIEYNVNEEDKTFWEKIQASFNRIFKPHNRYSKRNHGFIVFNKPAYKPGETVKFKGYVTDEKGNPSHQKAQVLLKERVSSRKDTLLTMLKPYRPGMYEWEFPITDSLNLQLDWEYYISLRPHKADKLRGIQAAFKFEEYTLDNNTFSVSTDKDSPYQQGELVKLTVDASDANGLAIHDGRLSILVTAKDSHLKGVDHAFIPDTLWYYETELEAKQTQEILVPDSIYPDNTELRVSAQCILRNADNEQLEDQVSWQYDNYSRLNAPLLHAKQEKGILYAVATIGNDTIPTRAVITNNETQKSDTVTLPFSMPWEKSTYSYTIKTSEDNKHYISQYSFKDFTDTRLYGTEDSVYLIVENYLELPFWYTVSEGNKDIASGYSTARHFKRQYKRHKKGFSATIIGVSSAYKSIDRPLTEICPYTTDTLTMEITTQHIVYPGQQVPIDIKLADIKGKPVKHADVTAYAFKSAFKARNPSIPSFNATRYAKPFNTGKRKWFEPNYYYSSRRQKPHKIDIELWRDKFGLDSIAFYNFLYPNPTFVYREPAEQTHIMPYVIAGGRMEPVFIVYIDDIPHYLHNPNHNNSYSIATDLTGLHTIRLRTFDKEVLIENVNIVAGQKNIISVDADAENHSGQNPTDENGIRIVVKPLPKNLHGNLSDYERQYLSRYMVSIEDWSDYPRFFRQYAPLSATLPGTTYSLDPKSTKQYDSRAKKNIVSDFLVGPFPQLHDFNSQTAPTLKIYSDTVLKTSFPIQPATHYYLDKSNNVQSRPWNRQLVWKQLKKYPMSVNFKQQPPTQEKLSQKFRHELLFVPRYGDRNTAYIAISNADSITGNNKVDLTVNKDTKQTEALRYVTIKDGANTYEYLFYYDNYWPLDHLPDGEARIYTITTDSLIYGGTPVKLSHTNIGKTLVNINCTTPIDDSLLKAKIFYIFESMLQYPKPIIPLISEEAAADSNKFATITGTVSDNLGPLRGATITVETSTGHTLMGVSTDQAGYYTLYIPKNEDNLSIVFSFVGYTPQRFKYIGQPMQDVTLKLSNIVLSSAEIRLHDAFGLARETIGYPSEVVNITQFQEMAIVSVEEMLIGKLSGLDIIGDGDPGSFSSIRIRGTASPGKYPLIVIDGVPQSDSTLLDRAINTSEDFASIAGLNPDDILSVDVLSGDNLIALWGERAANGVISITTRNGSGQFMDESGTSSIRHNFHDDAFWKPNLKTDREGKVSFEVTYPDDITKWKAYVIAVNKRGVSQAVAHEIKSLKPQAAQLSLPKFAIRGDSINVIGKLSSHLADTASVTRSISIDGNVPSQEQVSFSSLHIDTIAVKPSQGDSLTVKYVMSKPNGYFDGEERSIPVYPAGIMETSGEFTVLNGNGEASFSTDPVLGEATLFAQASAIDMFLDEIDRTIAYKYMCNEQMASKLKALAAKKRICDITGREFKELKTAHDLLKRLNTNMNSDGMWGWWERGKTEIWITRQVVEALTSSFEAGFTKSKPADKTLRGLQNELKNIMDSGILAERRRNDIADIAKMMRDYFGVTTHIPQPAYDTDDITILEYVYGGGDANAHLIDSLLAKSRRTMTGSMYWGDDERQGIMPIARVLRPAGGNVSATLAAYRILRKAGRHEAELEKIRNYFFEIRCGGSWRNTYESSRIIETILPDMLGQEGSFEGTQLTVNGRTVKDFPYKATFPAGDSIAVTKQGTLPVFLTVYQQARNERPKSEANGFEVRSYFTEAGCEVETLTSGRTVQLQVEVTVQNEAEYVMIEVPIPAGCDYESKRQGYASSEIHREHFKEKAAIFCSRLTPGKHKFTLSLTPRFTGRYTLNPASAELMYFPTFSGHEAVKTTDIR